MGQTVNPKDEIVWLEGPEWEGTLIFWEIEERLVWLEHSVKTKEGAQEKAVEIIEGMFMYTCV